MNHGKIAYLKVVDLEKKFNLNSSSNTSYNGYLELFKENINYSFKNNNDLTIDYPAFSIKSGQEICFQTKAGLNTTQECDITIYYILNNCVIYQEKNHINVGNNNLLIFKPYTPLSDEEVSFQIMFQTEDSLAEIIVDDVKTLVMGVSNANLQEDICLRALSTSDEDLLVSFIDNEKLYYTTCKKEVTSLTYDDFKYFAKAKSHSFSLEQFDSSKIILYKVDEQGNLCHCKCFEGEEDQAIDINVDVVHSCTCPESTNESNLIVYIKKGKCYYTTLTNNKLGPIKQFVLPVGQYNDIYAISNPYNDYIYVIASHTNGSNYIIKSIPNTSNKLLFEVLSSDILVTVSQYIDISFIKDKLTYNLNSNFSFNVQSIFKYQQCFDRVSKENFNINYSMTGNIYKLAPPVVYGVFFDNSVKTSKLWAKYTEEAIGMTGAYTKSSTNEFFDNGWLKRWPYSEIKPCIIKNGKVRCYLDPQDYSKTIDGQPSQHDDVSQGNVMIEIPKVYYSISKDKNKDVTVKISNAKHEGFECLAHTYKGKEFDKIYVSAYPVNHDNVATIGPHSNKGLVISKTYCATSYTKAYNEVKQFYGDGWEMMPYNTLVLLQCLFIIMFKSSNSQESLGQGRTSQPISTVCGCQDQMGMFCGGIDDINIPIKFFGLEDFYGFRGLITPGLYCTSEKKIKFIDVHNPNSSYDPNYIQNYISDPSITALATTTKRIPTDFFATPQIGFFGCNNTTTTNHRQYFGGISYLYADEVNYTAINTGVTMNLNGGIFNMMPVADIDNYNYTYRLIYYPN